ncbi:MAG: hypothetical protein IKO95_00250 [Spirochaetia bacterium]|nr:hypothetical protein [Spirochaetia bacterium]
MLDLTGIWFNTDGGNNEITIIRQFEHLVTIQCLSRRNGMNYESFGFGRLENLDQKKVSDLIITWAYTHSSQGGKKGVVHKTTIMVGSEDLMLQVEDELLTHGTTAKPDSHYGNWERGKKFEINIGGLEWST